MNIAFDFDSWFDGALAIVQDWTLVLEDNFGSFIEPLVDGLGFLVVIFGVWYGLRAILRAIRSVR